MSAAQVSHQPCACPETDSAYYPGKAGTTWMANAVILVLPQGAEAIKGQELGSDYYLKAVPVIEIQVARAGYRLAKWLDLIVARITAGEEMQDL